MSKRTLPKDTFSYMGVKYVVKKSFALPAAWSAVLIEELLNMKYIERIGA